jgi:putative peptidoglycan lipid II flippase
MWLFAFPTCSGACLPKAHSARPSCRCWQFRTQQGDAATKLLIDHVATVLTWVLLLTCVLGVLGAPVLVWIMASGLKAGSQGFEAAVVMTRWMFPYIGFMSMVALAAGVLNTWKRFAVPAATPVLLNLCMIAGGLAGRTMVLETRGIEPIYALGGGVILGGVLMQLTVQMLALRRLALLPTVGWRWAHLRQAWDDPATQRIATMMMPALLGVSVAHVSTVINTQIASHLTPGSVSWLTYADRLMEFPTALLGVALGVVLTPQTYALMGWGVGLVGIVAIKVLAPGYYASQDTKTPVRVAIGVLILTQLLNIALVPYLAHAALTLSIGIGALVNASWLLMGLIKRGSYKPEPGWGVFLLQVLAGCSLLAVFLMWANGHFNWTGLRADSLKRIGLLALILIASSAIYFLALWAAGMKLRQLARR